MLTEKEIAENKEAFLNACHAIQREGVSDLVEYLQTTDFFTAPSSSRFHGAFAGGLVAHSLNVYRRLKQFSRLCPETSADSMAVVALFHDVCKANLYKVSTRNVKNDETGRWEKVPFYQYDEQFPLGHGEKSLWIVSKYIRLTDDEALAIRWHMGGFDNAVRGGDFSGSKAFDKSPLALCLHLADMIASHIDEKEETP